MYAPGDIIYVKTDRRNKITPRYTKHQVKEDKENVVITTRDKVIHKDKIRK